MFFVFIEIVLIQPLQRVLVDVFITNSFFGFGYGIGEPFWEPKISPISKGSRTITLKIRPELGLDFESLSSF
jgi:hypothetical protein